jgi:hypothetical protein
MVDNLNPTNQFHPYTKPDVTPHSEMTNQGGLSGILRRVGMGNTSNVNVRQSVDKFRGYAQKNPGAVLGGLAALAIGMGMMRQRRR